MSCPECLSLTNTAGHCYTPGCENVQPAEQRPNPRPKPRRGLRKQSTRKRKELKATQPIREVQPGERCELCNSVEGVSTHEIPAGSHRHRAIYDRRSQLRVCTGCHATVQSIPYELQIVLKLEAMIAGINECHGSVAVTLEKVREAL